MRHGDFMKHSIRVVLLIVCAIIPTLASSPLQGTFHVPRGPHMVGAPFYLTFELRNTSGVALWVNNTDPLLPCAGYVFNISGERRADGACDGRRGFSCPLRQTILKPGGRITQHILLNYFYHFPHPGKYFIGAERSLNWWPASLGRESSERNLVIFRSDVKVDLLPASGAQLRAAFRPYVQSLNSKDPIKRERARQAVVYLAPDFLEKTIFDLLDSGDSWDGWLGLRNLNTPAARRKLAQTIEANATIPPGVGGAVRDEKLSERDTAVAYLAQMHDQAYFPLILSTVEQSSLDSSLRVTGIWAIGQLGQEKAIPFLDSEIETQSKDRQIQATIGLSFTASAESVPILISELNAPDDDLRQVAENSLQTLTHRAAVKDTVTGIAPEALRDEWQTWWSLNGPNAQIFAADDCGEVLPIK